MVRMPMVGMINHSMWSFDSQSQAYIAAYPQLEVQQCCRTPGHILR